MRNILKMCVMFGEIKHLSITSWSLCAVIWVLTLQFLCDTSWLTFPNVQRQIWMRCVSAPRTPTVPRWVFSGCSPTQIRPAVILHPKQSWSEMAGTAYFRVNQSCSEIERFCASSDELTFIKSQITSTTGCCLFYILCAAFLVEKVIYK